MEGKLQYDVFSPVTRNQTNPVFLPFLFSGCVWCMVKVGGWEEREREKIAAGVD